MQEHADVTGCRIVLSKEPEAVLLGSAILGSVAAGAHASVMDAMGAMSAAERVIEPGGSEVRAYHEKKHRVFHRMYDDQLAYRQLLEEE